MMDCLFVMYYWCIKLNKEDAMDRCKWRKVIKVIKEAR